MVADSSAKRTKKSDNLSIIAVRWAENETRARIRGRFSRNIFTPPNPWKGWVGSLRASLVSNEKSSPFGLLFFVERKTRLELATPTLARLCSTNWAISACLLSATFRLRVQRYTKYFILQIFCKLFFEILKLFYSITDKYLVSCLCNYQSIRSISRIIKLIQTLQKFLKQSANIQSRHVTLSVTYHET